MVQMGPLEGETVWDVTTQSEESLLTKAKAVSSMAVTQMSVE